MAILEFCQHPTLRYQWPSFLPELGANNWDSFWDELNVEIKETLRGIGILESRRSAQLRRLGDLRSLPADFKVDGEPLYDDADNDMFISSHYKPNAIKILGKYGLSPISNHEVLDLVEKDLQISKSRMRGQSTTAWHSAVAKRLCQFFDDEDSVGEEKLKSLALIPLVSGAWISGKDTCPWFPTTNGFDIPFCICQQIITPDATSDNHRVTLFRHLGAIVAEIRLVQLFIVNFIYDEKEVLYDRECLHFLYCTHLHLSSYIQPGTISILTDDQRRCWPAQEPVYFHGSAHPHSAKVLLAATEFGPGLKVAFTNPLYTSNVPKVPTASHPSWERWLYDFVGVQECLCMTTQSGTELSKPFLYVRKYRPESFLGLLEHSWSRNAVHLSSDVKQQLRDMSAEELCQIGYPVSLKDTWIPLKRLREAADYYLGGIITSPAQGFPFLSIDPPDGAGQVGSKWQFLCDELSVGYEKDLDFYLRILKCTVRSRDRIKTVSHLQRVYDLYTTIGAEVATTNISASDVEKLRCATLCPDGVVLTIIIENTFARLE